MAETAQDRVRLVAATANRLRLIQVDFADEPQDIREGYLADELQRALGKVLPDQRQTFIEELRSRFPTWDNQVPLAAAQESGPSTSAGDVRELNDPAFLVSKLVELAPKLSEGARARLTEQLMAAGLSGVGQQEWPDAPAKTLRTKLQMGEGSPIDTARALELMIILADVTCSLDQLVWNTWKNIAPKSTLRRQIGLAKTLGKFASGDQDTPRGQVTQDVEKLRQLTAALLSAIPQAGRQFAQRHLAKFAPSEIESAAAMEKGGLLVSHEVKCWRKYKELAGGMDEALIEGEIIQAIAEYGESLIKGLSR